jgi:antitoxin component of MazEF toxin-antitoxin module
VLAQTLNAGRPTKVFPFILTNSFCFSSFKASSLFFIGKVVEVNLVGGRDILINPTRRSKIGDPMDLIELARQVQTADHFTKANVTNKLSVIVDQIRYLQDQAKKILEEASQAQDLHHVPCNFKKIPGKMYYLYEKGPPNQRLFSMLSPQVTNHPLID